MLLPQRRIRVGVVAAAILMVPTLAMAQVGLGPRLSFVRGDIPSSVPSKSFIGGTLRTSGSQHASFEFALDYRAQTTTDKLQRVRETPLQISLLIYPGSRRSLAPYVLGGYGIYTDTTELLGLAGNVTATTTARRMGWHLGGGLELFVSRHASIYADFRFRFVHFGSADATSTTIPLPGAHLAHTGSMITSGLAFYF
jgi:opacity protein-like surface antigen